MTANDYWIKRVNELEKENERLTNKLIEEGVPCKHFDGKECRNPEEKTRGYDCRWCDYYTI